jgi:hypothetical protein
MVWLACEVINYSYKCLCGEGTNAVLRYVIWGAFDEVFDPIFPEGVRSMGLSWVTSLHCRDIKFFVLKSIAAPPIATTWTNGSKETPDHDRGAARRRRRIVYTLYDPIGTGCLK